jgi:hypothetical protein
MGGGHGAADGSCKLGQASFGAMLRSRMVAKLLAALARARIIRRPSSGGEEFERGSDDGGVIEDRGADGSRPDVRRNHYCRDAHAAEREVEGEER